MRLLPLPSLFSVRPLANDRWEVLSVGDDAMSLPRGGSSSSSNRRHPRHRAGKNILIGVASMLVRTDADRRARQRANAARYRRRQNARRGKVWVLRTTVRVEPLITWLVKRGVMPYRDEHTRAEIEEALTRLIDDLARE